MTLCWCLGLISRSAWGQISPKQEDRLCLHIPLIWYDLCSGCDVGRWLLSTWSVSHATSNSLCVDPLPLEEHGRMNPYTDTGYDVKSKNHVKCCKSFQRAYLRNQTLTVSTSCTVLQSVKYITFIKSTLIAYYQYILSTLDYHCVLVLLCFDDANRALLVWISQRTLCCLLVVCLGCVFAEMIITYCICSGSESECLCSQMLRRQPEANSSVSSLFAFQEHQAFESMSLHRRSNFLSFNIAQLYCTASQLEINTAVLFSFFPLQG